MYIGISVLQGGPGLPVFLKHFYNYLTNGEYLNLNIKIGDIPESGARTLLEKVGMDYNMVRYIFVYIYIYIYIYI